MACATGGFAAFGAPPERAVLVGLGIPWTAPADHRAEPLREACTNLRRRFEAEAELTQDVIDQALADFSEEDRAASQRLGISALAPTRADVERNRQQLWLGLDVVAGHCPAVSRKKRGLLSGVIPKAENALPAPLTVLPSEEDVASTPSSQRPRWRMEEGE